MPIDVSFKPESDFSADLPDISYLQRKLVVTYTFLSLTVWMLSLKFNNRTINNIKKFKTSGWLTKPFSFYINP